MKAYSPDFKMPQLWIALGVALVGLVVYLSLIPKPPAILEFTFADKVEHMLAYGTLMGWFGQLYVTMRRQIEMAAGFCALGILMEFLQGWGGHRMFDPWDMLANAAGVGLGWWLTRSVFAGFLLRIDRWLTR